MAIMIPNTPHEFEAASQEGLMFEALAKLPDDYYVFHSFRITSVTGNTFYESETDFVVFNRKLGLLCLEAKAGLVKYEAGYWYYASGIPMHNGGPFNQASSNKYKLKRSEADLLNQIKEIIVDNEALNGTFYVFYDKLQLIQARHMPKFIEDADCKLTLYRNCRNTENIATTSLRPISGRKPMLLEGCVKGAPAKIHFCSSDEAALSRIDETIDSLKSEGYKDIVILTSKTEATSILSGKVKDGVYRNKYIFSTCRKFKGLEADAIILIDVDGTSFNSDNVLIFYVGTSRARLRLDIITELTNDDCSDILRNVLETAGKIRNPKRELASALNATGSIAD